MGMSEFLFKAVAEKISGDFWMVYPDGDKDSGRVKVEALTEFEAKEEAYLYLKELDQHVKGK